MASLCDRAAVEPRTRSPGGRTRDRLRGRMSGVLDFEARDTPGPVAFAGMIGIAKAIFEAGFGLLGLAVANSMDDSFGGALLAFGIVYAIASWLLLRGRRLGYYVTIALSTLGLVVAVVYAFRADAGLLG